MPSFCTPILVLFLVVFGNTSASKADVVWTYDVFLRSDEQAHVPAALEHAINSFVGVGGSSVASQIPSDFLTRSRSASSSSSGSTRVTYTQSRSRRFGGRVTAAAALSGPLSFEGSGLLAYGQSNYELPNGAGVHIQGIDIRFRTVSAELDAALSYQATLFGSVPLKLSAGAGVFHAHTKTSVDSPILRIRESNRDTIPFAMMRFGVRLPEHFGPDVGAVLEIRNYADFGPTAAFEINMRF
ncbi:hypothetical protein CSC82_16740 [Rhodobacteraceae bacterium 4F10]|nr:hypothetical protein CSC82_16740 [Rhodobacteraceae bacterium 4F10]